MVNAGLQGLGIKAPPPLVKSTILGNFPIPTTTLQSILEEDESSESKDATSKSNEQEGLDPKVDNTDLKSSEAEDNNPHWYEVVYGPNPEADVELGDVQVQASGCNNTNAVHDLITKVHLVCLIIKQFCIWSWLCFEVVSSTSLVKK